MARNKNNETAGEVETAQAESSEVETAQAESGEVETAQAESGEVETLTADGEEKKTSIYTRAKHSLIQVYDQLKQTGYDLADMIPDAGVREEFIAIAETILETAQKGLPNSVKLERVKDAISALYKKARVTDGVLDPTEEWEAERDRLMVRKNNIVRAIKAEKENVESDKAEEAAQANA